MNKTALADTTVAKKILSEHKTLTLATSSDERVWAGKVYYGEHDGYLYVALEKGHTYRNLTADPRVFFVVDHDVPDSFVQGEGIAEFLGPIEDLPERHFIFRNAFEAVIYVRSCADVEVIRIRPTRLYVSDFTGDWKPRAELEVTDEVLLSLSDRSHKTGHSAWKVYWKATRPFAFTASTIPAILGTLLAPNVSLPLFLLMLMGIMLLHAGVNVLSDYFDYMRGADTWRALGSSRVLVDGLLAPERHVKWGSLLFSLGLLVGLLLTYLVGPVVLWIGVAGATLGFFYAAPPVGLKYRALGDMAVFLAFGPLMVAGAYYVQMQHISWPIASLGLPVGFLTMAILHANNLRDIEDDTMSGYQTLAALLQRQRSSVYYLMLIAGAYSLTLVYIALGYLPLWAFLVFLTLPAALKNIRLAFSPARVAFAFLDLMTAQLHLIFGLALVVGLVLGRWVHI